MKNKAKNFVFVSSINAVNMLFPIAVIPLVIKSVGLKAYGEFAFAQSIVGYLSLVVGYGLTQVGSFSYLNAKCIEEKKTISTAILKIRAVVFVFTGIAVLGVLKFTNTNTGLSVLILIFYFGLLSEVVSPLWICQATEKFHIYTISNVVGKVITTILIYVSVIYGHGNLLEIAISFLIGNLLTGAVSFWMSLDDLKLNWPQFKTNRTEYNLWRSGMYILASDLTTNAKDRIAGFIIVDKLGYSDFSLFDIVNKIVVATTSIATNAITVLMPGFVKKGCVGLDKIMYIMLALGFVCYALLVIASGRIAAFFHMENQTYLFEILVLVMGIWVPIVCVSATIARLFFVRLGLNKLYLTNTILTTFVAITLLTLSSVYTEFTVITVSICLVLSVIFELVSRLFIQSKIS